jgi:hypothetical protein
VELLRRLAELYAGYFVAVLVIGALCAAIAWLAYLVRRGRR